MITLKQLINCDLRCENGEITGKAQNALADKDTGQCALITNSGEIYAAKKVTDTVIDVIKEEQSAKKYAAVLGKTAYDNLGNRLGVIENAAVNRKMTLRKIMLDDGKQFNRSQILALGDIAIIKTVTKPRKKKKTANEHMNISADEQTKDKTEIKDVCSQVKRRRYGDFTFLIGKTAEKNIVNFFGEIMIKSGERITAEILRQAKISGKLIELCLHSY